MTDSEFLSLAESLFACIENNCDTWFETLDIDVETQRNGSVLRLVFNNRDEVVINLQTPLHEIWLAAKEGAYHFQWNGSQWLSTKTGIDFLEELSTMCTHLAGQPLKFTAN